ncbi:hypothetical protein [Accumulibacter sp.]|uniref:hypothetical protein n=1 Tax=Accumulibacter sp. TaxID=2053492 RepID=UPI001AD5CAB5|nr:hypothetical protein [Accumulibacter sp.]MBN8452436.1 hypothetical protein [Accumulibacter sp.]
MIPLLDQRILFVDQRVVGAGRGLSAVIRFRRNPEFPQVIENRPHGHTLACALDHQIIVHHQVQLPIKTA